MIDGEALRHPFLGGNFSSAPSYTRYLHERPIASFWVESFFGMTGITLAEPSNVMNFLTIFLLTLQFPPSLKLLKEPTAFSLTNQIAYPLSLTHFCCLLTL